MRPNIGGLILGLVATALSVTPSLVPRPPIFQGLIAGLSFLLGYAVGVLLLWGLSFVIRWRPSALVLRNVWIGVGVAILLGGTILTARALVWQNDVRRLVEMEPVQGQDVLVAVLAALAVIVIGFGISAGIRRLNAVFATLFARAVVSTVVTVVAVCAVAAASGALVMSVIDGIYADRNSTVSTELIEPASTYRSTGAGSALSWESLGSQGRAFIAGGPTRDEIEAVTESAAVTPIRVYAGLDAGDTLADRAALAVEELERTGAFDRETLVVATTTGSGWLEPQSMDALEYLHGGDTAIVSMQYAYTPSWVSFLFDQDLPVAASTALFTAVYDAWSVLPADERPQLIAYGLSLGAHGMQSVFTDLDDVRERTDGAVFVGSPNGTPLWNELQDARDAGSQPWQPVLDQGEAVRWLSSNGDFDALAGPWNAPRVAYLQHGSDPVVWLGPRLIWAAPDWLRDGQRAPDVSEYMRWIPGVTGLQVLVDMLMGESVPASHGHNYGDVILGAWLATTTDAEGSGSARPSDEVLDRIQTLIESYADLSSISE